MFLQTTVIGYLGKDAWINETNGKKVVNFSVAYTEKYKNAQGVDTEKTTWVECAMWEKEKVAPFLLKGTLVQCIGRPSTNAFVNKQGELMSSLKLGVISLQLLSSGKKEGTPPVPVPENGEPNYVHDEKIVGGIDFKVKKKEPIVQAIDDDLPF